ncbi:MAG TPA: hypothetical protein VFX70_13885 [Mycobacteriales bacterium]|nr:hypothetical protein [Mycobacteriales bacterium]
MERLAFTCGGCGQSWSADYDVQHVEDGHGHDRDYYFLNGVPCPDPTGPGAVLCPGCGRAHVTVELTARRASPAVIETVAGDLGTRPGSDKVAVRADAPLLAGTAGNEAGS